MTTFDETGAAPVVRELAFRAAKPELLEAGCVYAVATSNGDVRQIDLTDDKWLDFPQRKRGTVIVRNVAGFGQYWAKHHDDDSEVFADLDAGTVTAVLDAHRNAEATADGDGNAARWEDHRLVLQLQKTLQWARWTGRDRKMQTQADFAEFIEDNARDVDPGGTITSADLLEIAQKFQAHTKVSFTSGKRLSSGEAEFEFTEQVTASTGGRADRGTIQIPTEFDLAIWPYEDCEAQSIAARFRYRINGGDLLLGYFLNDPARVAREAVAGIVAKLEAECDVTVMHGQPAA